MYARCRSDLKSSKKEACVDEFALVAKVAPARVTRVADGTYSTCVYMLVMWRRPTFESRRSDPVVRGAARVQVPAWREYVEDGVFSARKRLIRQPLIDRSIVYYTLLIIFSTDATRSVFVAKDAWRIGRGGKKVRNSDTGLMRIEKISLGYI